MCIFTVGRSPPRAPQVEGLIPVPAESPHDFAAWRQRTLQWSEILWTKQSRSGGCFADQGQDNTHREQSGGVAPREGEIRQFTGTQKLL